MRIAEVLLRPGVGGAESLAANLSRHWLAEGHDVRTFHVDDGPDDPAGRLARVRRLVDAFRRFDPDVVHAHSALPNLYARLAARGRWSVVTVLHSAGRDFDVRTLRVAERALARWTAHVVAVSPEHVREYRLRFGARVPVTLIPNGVRGDITARTSPTAGPHRAVAVGRLAPQKRVDLLIDGWRRAALPGAELRIAGPAGDAATRREVAGWAGEVAGVTLLGAVDDVPRLLAGSDLFVHAATREAHPLAPIEAACAGLPVVVTDEVAATLPAGLPAGTFPGGDADGLAAALRAVRASYPELAAAAVRRAPEIAREFSLPRCADRHLAVLRASVPTGRPLVAGTAD